MSNNKKSSGIKTIKFASTDQEAFAGLITSSQKSRVYDSSLYYQVSDYDIQKIKEIFPIEQNYQYVHNILERYKKNRSFSEFYFFSRFDGPKLQKVYDYFVENTSYNPYEQLIAKILNPFSLPHNALSTLARAVKLGRVELSDEQTNLIIHRRLNGSLNLKNFDALAQLALSLNNNKLETFLSVIEAPKSFVFNSVHEKEVDTLLKNNFDPKELAPYQARIEALTPSLQAKNALSIQTGLFHEATLNCNILAVKGKLTPSFINTKLEKFFLALNEYLKNSQDNKENLQQVQTISNKEQTLLTMLFKFNKAAEAEKSEKITLTLVELATKHSTAVVPKGAHSDTIDTGYFQKFFGKKSLEDILNNKSESRSIKHKI